MYPRPLAETTTGLVVYAVIRNASDQVWNGTAFVTYNAANWTTYAVTLTEQGATGHYSAAFPAGISTAGLYAFVSYVRSGGSAATTDAKVFEGTIDTRTTAVDLSGVTTALDNLANGTSKVTLAGIQTINRLTIWPDSDDSDPALTIRGASSSPGNAPGPALRILGGTSGDDTMIGGNAIEVIAGTSDAGAGQVAIGIPDNADIDAITEKTDQLAFSGGYVDANAVTGGTTAADVWGYGTRTLTSNSSGGGDVAVNHDYGGTDNYRAVDPDGNPIDDVLITAYLVLDTARATIIDQVRTGSDGRWLSAMMLDADDYVLVFAKPGVFSSFEQPLTVT